MDLLINGKKQPFPDGISAEKLIEQLGLEDQKLAMEVNCEIVPRSTYATHILQSGDAIEIVRAIGGGASCNVFRSTECLP